MTRNGTKAKICSKESLSVCRKRIFTPDGSSKRLGRRILSRKFQSSEMSGKVANFGNRRNTIERNERGVKDARTGTAGNKGGTGVSRGKAGAMGGACRGTARFRHGAGEYADSGSRAERGGVAGGTARTARRDSRRGAASRRRANRGAGASRRRADSARAASKPNSGGHG